MINYSQKKITFLTLEEMEFFIMDETMIVHLIVIELSKDVKRTIRVFRQTMQKSTCFFTAGRKRNKNV